MSSRARTAPAEAGYALRCLKLARGMVVTWGLLEPEQGRGTLYPVPGLLRVVHVCRGRCVLVLPDGGRIEIAEGDVAVLGTSVEAVGVELRDGPVGGMCLSVDSRRLPADMRRVFSGFDVNVEVIARMVPPERPVVLAHDNAELVRVFSEAYPLVDEGNVGYLRLKAVERDSDAHVRHLRVALQAQQEMLRDVSRPKTIPTLAAMCGTSPTILKEAFRETFGVPIYTWYREYRVRLAAEALLESDLPIAEVAASVGYSNPSKFAKAFADTMGSTPREWRAVGGLASNGGRAM